MKRIIFLLFLLFSLFPLLVVAREPKEFIEMCWQDLPTSTQIREYIKNNTANFSTESTAPRAKSTGVYPSHNNSVEYPSIAEADYTSRYSRFDVTDIRDDTIGGWCFATNVSDAGPEVHALVGISQAYASENRQFSVRMESPSFDFHIQDSGSTLPITEVNFGTLSAGQRTFVCVGNNGSLGGGFWAFQDGAYKTITMAQGSNGWIWYNNGSAFTNATFGATNDYAYRLRFDANGGAWQGIAYYLNASPSTEELNTLYNSPGDPLNCTNFLNNVSAAPDTTPPEVDLINLTSEGGLGQIIFDEPNGDYLGKLNGSARTNDTTPTFFIKTNEAATCCIIDNNADLNWTDCYAGTTNNDAGAPSTTHTLTLNESNATGRVGLFNFSVGCKDSSGNENSTSTSGKFTINITDNVPPNVTLFTPRNGTLLRIGTNTTNVQFNFSATDNLDNILTNCSLFFNSTLQANITNYINNTLVSFNITLTSANRHAVSVNCSDSFNNKNGSNVYLLDVLEQQFQINVTLLINGTNSSKSVEFNTTLLNKDYGIEINLSIINNKTVYLDFDYFINWSQFYGNRSILLNITELNVTMFKNGTFSLNLSGILQNISMVLDNNTDIMKVGFKIKGYPDFPVNVSIDIDNDGKVDITIPGTIRGNEAEINEFSTSLGTNRRAQNFTFLTAGSQTININVSSDLNFKNLSMQLSSFSLDAENEFSYTETYNTSEKAVNLTLTTRADAPMGVLDDFVANNSKWILTSNYGTGCSFRYETQEEEILFLQCPTAVSISLTHSGSGETELVNSSKIEILARVFSEADNIQIKATDGTNAITLYAISSTSGLFNYTLNYIGNNRWFITKNGSDTATVDISSLDFSQPIKLRFDMVGNDAGNQFSMRYIKWSGAWLNMSDLNGTYHPNGNLTSQVVNYTNTNVSRATLTWTAYEPAGTKVLGYLSNTCNSSNPTFDNVLNGITNIFTTTGNALCVRFNLNSSVNTTSPIVKKWTASVTKGSARNISIDCGADGDADWQFLKELNTTTSPRVVNCTMADFNSYKSTNCNATMTCNLPVSISTKSTGLLSIDSLNFTQYLNEITIKNLTKFEDKTNWNWSVKQIGSVLEFYDLDVEFLGSKNFTLYAYSESNATYTQGTANLTLQVYYSKFNASQIKGVSFYNVFPSSKDSKNVTPFSQTSATPIWNITNLAYDLPFDMYVRLNETQHSCMNVTYNNASNKTEGNEIILNTTFQFILSNISKANYRKEFVNHTINISMNGSSANSTILTRQIANEEFSVINLSSNLLTRDTDYRINFTTGNFTLYNVNYNISSLFANYNYSTSTPNKGIWNWWDFSNCTGRFIIKKAVFQPYCEGCVRNG